MSTVFASVLAGFSLTTASHGATPAADDCLSAPRGQTPEGNHWYYRIERGTKRHCWYLREEGEKLSQSAPSSAAPSAKPIAPKAEPAIRGSVANARAELPAAQTRDAADSAAATAPQPSAPGLNAANPTASLPLTAPDASTQPSMIASRWPGPSSANPSAGPAQAAADPDDADLQPTPPAAAPPAAAPPPPVALAAADAPSEKSQGRSGSIPMLSVVMIGALALAGLIGSAIVRFGGRRRRNRSDIAVDRDAIWDAISTEPRSSRAAPDAIVRMPRSPGFTLPRELQMADHAANRQDRQDDRITEMLARLARSAAS